jgi:hypothetical protein
MVYPKTGGWILRRNGSHRWTQMNTDKEDVLGRWAQISFW